LAVDAKVILLGAVDAALRAVHGRERVRDFLARRTLPAPVWVIAIGKAAVAMSHGAADVLGGGIASALVISKRGLEEVSFPVLPAFTHVTAGHPIPDEGSLAAGQILLQTLESAPRNATFLFLISGGASSLVEVLPPGVTLADLRAVNEWLLASGRDIGAMNDLRKRFSCIKGGRLAQWLQGRPTCNLLISDVPGDDPACIGSGLLTAGRRGDTPSDNVPAWLESLLRRLPASNPPDSTWSDSVSTHIVASPGQARKAAVDYVRGRGEVAHGHDDLLVGDYREIAKKMAGYLHAAPRGVHVWSGEPTVRLPPRPGRGGRNQSLALAVAREIYGDSYRAFVSVGTDGNDGGSEDAGAVVDNDSIEYGTQLGLDAEASLARADAGTYLEAIGALIRTGPTGTNVMDLMLGFV
jgi:glycerate 2-kinase